MEHTNQSILVKVSALVPSPYNVRRASPTSVEELAALIDQIDRLTETAAAMLADEKDQA